MSILNASQTIEEGILIGQGMQTAGIIGLGYVGLPTTIGFHDAGFTVYISCVDLDWNASFKKMKHLLLYYGRRVINYDALELTGLKSFTIMKPQV